MGISARKRARDEALRQRVLDAAEDIIVREGAQRVTMRRVAGRVEYASTVLYRLFTGKDDLLDHLIARGYGGLGERYDEIRRQPDLSPVETLTEILREYVTYALDHPNQYRIWFETGSVSVVNGYLKMRHKRLEFIVFQAWLEAIEVCQEASLWPGKTPLEVFTSIWPQIHGVISLRLQNPKMPWPPVAQHLHDVLDLRRSA